MSVKTKILFLVIPLMSLQPSFARTLGGLDDPYANEFAQVTELLENKCYSEAERAARNLIPKCGWGYETSMSVNKAGYTNAFTHHLKAWEQACKRSGDPAEMERLYDVCIQIGKASGHAHTSEFENLSLLAAEKSVELKHYQRVSQLCKMALDSRAGSAAVKGSRIAELANRINVGSSTKFAAAIYHLLDRSTDYQADLIWNHSVFLRSVSSSKNYTGADQVTANGTELISQYVHDQRVKKFFNDFAKRRMLSREYDGVAIVFSEWASRKTLEKHPLKSAKPRAAINPDDALLASLIVQDGFGGHPQTALPMCKLQIAIAEQEHQGDAEMVKIYSIYRCVLQSCNLKKEVAVAAQQVAKYSARAK